MKHDTRNNHKQAHTRWATHGQPSPLNSHPHRSDANNEFTIVHNGIITNYKEIKTLLEKKGFSFETETDTECVAKLTKYIYDSQKENNITFTALVKAVAKELEGSYAFIFKSVHYPNEVIATRRGSPLLVGVKTAQKLKVDFVDVEFGNPTTETETGNEKKINTPFLFILFKLKEKQVLLIWFVFFFSND